jgi:hypothetical protein
VTKVERFFAEYEQGANSFDTGLIVSEFTSSFMAADPNGVTCIHNDERFRAAIPERHAFFRQIGFKSAKVINMVETQLDDRYTMAKVQWHLVFEKQKAKAQDFRFFITYFLFDPGSGPKVAFYISHEDERKVMQEAGLVPR